jgi:hypothetical protein
MTLKQLKHHKKFIVIGDEKEYIYIKIPKIEKFNCKRGEKLFYFPLTTLIREPYKNTNR